MERNKSRKQGHDNIADLPMFCVHGTNTNTKERADDVSIDIWIAEPLLSRYLKTLNTLSSQSLP